MNTSLLVPPCVFELVLGAGTTYRFVFAGFLNFRVLTWTEYSLDYGGCSGGTLDFNFFVENGLAEFLKPSQWLRTTYEAPYQRYE
jgi:hypothetical protein